MLDMSLIHILPPLAGVTGSAVLFALLNQLPQGWLGVEGTPVSYTHLDVYKRQMLEMVGIANSQGVYEMYPHELSGGCLLYTSRCV